MTSSSVGIDRLMYVCEMKRQNANESALDGADKQRVLVKEQKDIRDRQRKLEEFVGDKNLTDGEYWAIARMMNDSGLSTQNTVDGSYNGILGYFDAGHSGEVGHWNASIGKDASNALDKANADKIESVRKGFEGKQKDLEAEDKMGAYEIQDLMSQYNQSESLLNSVRGKLDKTTEGGISKIA
jgi:hypothetical protein